MFPVQQVIYLEITFSSYVYLSLVNIYFSKVLNSFTEDSSIRPSLTKRFFFKLLIPRQYTYESLQATKFASEGGVFSTEPELSHDPLSGSSHVVSIALDRNSSFCCYATLSPIGPDDEGILLCSKYLHPRQNNLGNKMYDLRLLWKFSLTVRVTVRKTVRQQRNPGDVSPWMTLRKASQKLSRSIIGLRFLTQFK